jgi:hypothetical protein
MKTFTIIILTLLILYSSCKIDNRSAGQLTDSSAYFSVEQLQSDFNQFRNHLESCHPKLYHFTSKSSLDSMFDAHLALITDSMHVSEFYTILAPVIARIGCGHTSIWPPAGFWSKTPDKMVPLHVYVSQDKRVWILQSLDSASIVPPGSELISINDIPVTELTEIFLSQLNADGYNRSLRIWKLNRRFQELFALNFGHYNTFDIAYQSNEKKYSVHLPAASGQDIRSILNPERDDGWLYGGLKYERFDEHNAALIKLLTFAYYGDENPKFHAFIDDCFRDIRENGIENLVLDLRDNDGGDPYCSVHLLAYLEPEPIPYFSKGYHHYEHMADPISRATNPFEGNLFILVNGGCLSTTGHFTSVLKYHNIGTFAGTETGATYTCNDASKMIELDHTRIYVNSPRATFATAVEGFPEDRGIIPDIIIEPDIKDLVNGKDTELDFIINELL